VFIGSTQSKSLNLLWVQPISLRTLTITIEPFDIVIQKKLIHVGLLIKTNEHIFLPSSVSKNQCYKNEKCLVRLSVATHAIYDRFRLNMKNEDEHTRQRQIINKIFKQHSKKS